MLDAIWFIHDKAAILKTEDNFQRVFYIYIYRTINKYMYIYVDYSESKYRLRISLAHPRDCHFAHVQ